MTRPSDRAIAQAFAEFQEATIAVPVGHYDDTKGSSTYNWRRSFESTVLARAAELDATAAPVVVGEDTKRLDWLATQFRTCTVYMSGSNLYKPGIGIQSLIGPDFRGAIDAAMAAALAGDTSTQA
ncbi:hypothetical protein [Luteibacter sp.]|uniref:hypothetical protein n=1 Tax=Luteibacter sp. TaxID=1886636 RepID=UPI002808261A|nr:hypothetical protein [Luteibacter sp.]MDQ8050722.1 hypothetical protein [Luteibacter sp.]